MTDMPDSVSMPLEATFFSISGLMSIAIIIYTVKMTIQRPTWFNMSLAIVPLIMVIWSALNLKTVWIVYFYDGGHGHLNIDNATLTTDPAYKTAQLWKENDYISWIILGTFTLIYILNTQFRLYICRLGLPEHHKRREQFFMLLSVLIFIPTNIVLIWGMYYEIGQQWVGTCFGAWAAYLVIMDSYISTTTYKSILKMKKDIEQSDSFDQNVVLNRKREIKETILRLILTCGVTWVNVITNVMINVALGGDNSQKNTYYVLVSLCSAFIPMQVIFGVFFLQAVKKLVFSGRHSNTTMKASAHLGASMAVRASTTNVNASESNIQIT